MEDTTNNQPVVTQPTQHESHLNASQIFLVLGVALILVASAAIVFNNWADLNAMSKFSVVAVPNILLLLISFLVKNEERYTHIKDATLAVGLVLLPVSIGTFLYQFEILTEIDAQLFFISVAAATPVSLYYDFLRKKGFAAFFSVLGILLSVLFLGIYSDWQSITWDIVWSVLAAIIFGGAVWASKRADSIHKTLYQAVSAIIGVFAVPALVSTILTEIDPELGNGVWVAWGAVMGVVLLYLSTLYKKLFEPVSRVELTIQRVIQLGALFVIFGPLFTACGDNSAYIAVAIIISILVGLFGMLLGVNLMFIGGVVGLVVNLLIVLFREVALQQILLLFILGFGAIGLSLALAKLKSAKRVLYSPELALRYGIISDAMGRELSIDPIHPEKRRVNPWMIVIFVLASLWIIPMLLGLIFNAISGTRID